MNQNIINDRIKNLDFWRNQGISGYKNDVKVNHTNQDVQINHSTQSVEELEQLSPKPIYQIAGRVMLIRRLGKIAFGTLRDRTGDLQVAFNKRTLDETTFENMKHLDLGDIIWVQGTPFRTTAGELTIQVEQMELLTKNMRPLPEKYHGLSDVETRYRYRYEDLATNLHSREIFLKRNKIVQYIRQYLLNLDFLEVETPMMHSLLGGAAAKPFITHHNALDVDLYLRVAPELHLKRLLVGGFERVFELNRCFRNEGIDTTHNPEFTSLEFYQSYATYEDLILLTENLLSSLVGENEITYGEYKISFKAPFAKMTVKEAIVAYNNNISLEDLENQNSLQNLAKKLSFDVNLSENYGKLLMSIFDVVVEPNLIQPTFITQFPIEVSPLARKNEQNPQFVDRFELYIAEMEVANAFSELNDPQDQKERFLEQVKAKNAGDGEANDYDEDYIRALEIGMPPAAGEGIGIDRLVMLLTNSQSIREVLLFPQMKPLI